jgi:hypothetical protein
MGFLCLVTLAFVLLAELTVSVWAFLSRPESSLDAGTCLGLLPRYCLQLPVPSPSPVPEAVLALIRAFFFAALVSLFYELYKALVEWYRARYIESAILGTFRWIFNRKTGTEMRYIPWYRSFSYLKTTLGLTDDEIVRTCARSECLRVANLASTRATSSYQYDKYVVECYYKTTPYGARIDNNSNITIIVAQTTLGLSKFGCYLAYFGGFNFIAKEIDTEESFYNVTAETRKAPFYNHFKRDLEELTDSSSSDKRLIVLLTAYKYKKSKKIYLLNSTKDKQKPCTCSDAELNELTSRLTSRLSELDASFAVKNTEDDTSDDYYLWDTDEERNLLYEIGCGPEKNGVVIGIPSNINVWDIKRIKTILAIAAALKNTDLAFNSEILSERRTGFDFLKDTQNK